MPDQVLRLGLTYKGPEVEDGTMPVEDMISALQGFSSAYEKVANLEGKTEVQHRIRVITLQKGSADILVGVWQWLADNASQLKGVEILAGAGVAVVTTIIAVIRIRKHAEGKPVKIKASEHGIVITNSKNVNLVVAPKDFEIHNSGVIDRDLGKLVKPLRENQIVSMELSSPEHGIHEAISASDRALFMDENKTVSINRDVWVEGVLNSLAKSTNSGTFYLKNGESVRYRLVGDRPDLMYPDFAYKGPVSVLCDVHLNDALEPTLLEIKQIQRLQRDLFT